MDDQKLCIFNAIASFVQDLDTSFGKKYKPVALFNRLISKTTLRDTISIQRHIDAFTLFFNNNPEYIDTKKINENTRIIYSDRVYLDIGHILSKADAEARTYIHQHLVTIYSLINVGTEKGREAVESLKTTATSSTTKPVINVPDTSEGKFIQNTLEKITDQFNDIDENTNPMQVVTQMMSNGFFSEFMGELQTKMSSGELDMKNLMTTVTSAVTEGVPGGTENAEYQETMKKTFESVSGIMGAAGISGGQGNPADIMNMMSGLMSGQPGPTSSQSPPEN